MELFDAQVDARGLNCPLPILKATRAIKTLSPGQLLEVISSDPGSMKDMLVFCKQTGNELRRSEANEDGYFFLIEKC